MTQSFGLPAPVNAPWPANWNNYPVQYFQLTGGTADEGTLRVPEGQYWRPIFFRFTWHANGSTTTRFPLLEFFSGIFPAQPLSILAPDGFTTAADGTFVFGPTLNSYVSPTSGGQIGGAIAIPDLIWPPDTLFIVSLLNAGIGDVLQDTGTIAMEVFTEDASGNLEPVPPPVASPIIV